MEAITNPFRNLNPIQNYSNYRKTNEMYKKQSASHHGQGLKQLKADEVTFKGNENKIDKQKALELVKGGARVYHAARGTYHFVDGSGKIYEATNTLQDAIDAGNFADVAVEQVADELVSEGGKELLHALADAALTAGCTVQ